VTNDPIYWSVVIISGLLAAIVAYQFDPAASKLNPVVCMAAGFASAVLGAMVVGPLLQLAWRFVFGPATEIIWPAPVSLDIRFLLGGIWVSVLAFALLILVRNRLVANRRDDQ
jgi:hypothetical protein